MHPDQHRIFIRYPEESDGPKLLSLHQRSQDFHSPWAFPALTTEGILEYINRCQRDDFVGLLICMDRPQTIPPAIIGVANLSQILYRSFQNAYLGYYADIRFARQGFMKAGLRLVINHAFHTLGLHRLEANIQPKNEASLQVVRHLGFTKEGFSKRYLKINDQWCDHERWALTIEDWPLKIESDRPIKSLKKGGEIIEQQTR